MGQSGVYGAGGMWDWKDGCCGAGSMGLECHGAGSMGQGGSGRILWGWRRRYGAGSMGPGAVGQRGGRSGPAPWVQPHTSAPPFPSPAARPPLLPLLRPDPQRAVPLVSPTASPGTHRCGADPQVWGGPISVGRTHRERGCPIDWGGEPWIGRSPMGRRGDPQVGGLPHRCVADP